MGIPAAELYRSTEHSFDNLQQPKITFCIYSSPEHHRGQTQAACCTQEGMKGMVSTEKMQIQLRISKSNYEKQVVEIMIHQELNQKWSPVLHSVHLVMAVRIPGLQKSFLELFKCTEGLVIDKNVMLQNYPSTFQPDLAKCLGHPSPSTDSPFLIKL